MKLHGYCEKCHKIKRVRVRPQMLAMGRYVGVCDACQDAEDEKRKERR